MMVKLIVFDCSTIS